MGGEFPEEVKALFEKAVQYYEENMMLMVEIGDRAAQGRACGNLGNVHYLLGNFSRAIHFHEERLKIAKEFRDQASEKRAYNNLGNAHIFLCEFEKAAEHYHKTLSLSKELGNSMEEAIAYFSLGNTYRLIERHDISVQYHLKHLSIARTLDDKYGELAAYRALEYAYTAIGDIKEANHNKMKRILMGKCINIGSKTTGQVFTLANFFNPCEGSYKKYCKTNEICNKNNHQNSTDCEVVIQKKTIIPSHDSVPILKSTVPILKSNSTNQTPDLDPTASEFYNEMKDLISFQDSFFDSSSKFQGDRMNEQRYSSPVIVPPHNNSMSSDDSSERTKSCFSFFSKWKKRKTKRNQDLLHTTAVKNGRAGGLSGEIGVMDFQTSECMKLGLS